MFAGLFFAAAMDTALAQVAPPPPPPPPNPPADTRPVSARPQFESTDQISTAVSKAVNQRLAPSAGNAAPLNYALGYASGSGTESEAAAALDNPPPMLWNVWGDAQASRTKRKDPVGGFDGPLSTVSLGLDYAFPGTGLFGLFGNVEKSDYDLIQSNGSLKSDGRGLGAYAGVVIGNAVVADAMVVWKQFDNDIANPVSTASYDSTRWQAAANLTGYWYFDALRFSPTVGINWSRERQDGYTDSAGFAYGKITQSTVAATGGVQVGYRVDTQGGASIEPWLGIGGDWEISRPTSDIAAVPPGDKLSRFDTRVSAGVNAQLTPSVTLSFSGEVGGLTRDNYSSVRGGGQLSVRF